jgi:hypothetical protein
MVIVALLTSRRALEVTRCLLAQFLLAQGSIPSGLLRLLMQVCAHDPILRVVEAVEISHRLQTLFIAKEMVNLFQ